MLWTPVSLTFDGFARSTASAARCVTRQEAADYLGIGVTLLESLGVPALHLGRRRVYDRVDLDAWLDDYKSQGRAGKETQWPAKPGSTRRLLIADDHTLLAEACKSLLEPEFDVVGNRG